MTSFLMMFIFSIILYIISRIIDGRGIGVIILITSFWSIQILSSFLGTNGIYSWKYKGVCWIYVEMFLFIFAYCLSRKYFFKDKVNKLKHTNFTLSSISWKLLLFFILIGLIKWVYEIKLNGFQVQDFFSLESLENMNNSFAVARYSSSSKQNTVSQILNIFVYVAPFCGGFAYNCALNKKQKLYSLLTLLPALLTTLTVNTKATIIGAGIAWVVSFIVSYRCIYRKSIVISFSTILKIVLIFMSFIMFMIFSMMLRIGSVDAKTFIIVMRKLIIYAFGNIQSFDIWLSEYWNNSGTTNGSMTFLGVFNSIGLMERVQGVYTSLPGTSSNVFTVFRGVIEDFGTIGGLIFTTVSGFVLGVSDAYVFLKRGIPVLAIVISVSTLFFYIYGFIISPWTYSSYILAVLLFAIYLIIAKGSLFKVKIKH